MLKTHLGSQTSEDNNANKFQRKASPLMFNSPKLNNTDRYQNSQEGIGLIQTTVLQIYALFCFFFLI